MRVASQSVGRLLIQTGRRLDELTLADFEELHRRLPRTGRPRPGRDGDHYRSALNCRAPGAVPSRRSSRRRRRTGKDPSPRPSEWPTSPAALRPAFVAYLERKAGDLPTQDGDRHGDPLAHFGRFLAEIDPDSSSLAELDRQRHIEPYLNSLTSAVNTKTGEPITIADQARRIRAVSSFLTDITEWGWDDAPRPASSSSAPTCPRLPQPLPRYLPVDADRRLGDALARSEFRLAADALLLQRACGLRIGELLDLELDCVHEIPGNGAWLKVPLGKLDTERMVPLDDETVALIDRIVATRSEGRPLPHPRTGRPAQFLFTHHGRRLGPAGSAPRTRPRRGRPPASATSPPTSSATRSPPPW